MVATVAEQEITPGPGQANELLGDMAELLNNTRPLMLTDGVLLAGLVVGLVLEAGSVPAPRGALAFLGGFLLACLFACWLVAAALLGLAARPILGIVNDHRWKAGAPLDPRARWLSLPPISATREEWIWVRAHLMVGAARIRLSRMQHALTWTLIATGSFLGWTIIAMLANR
jgi:hypothetical protein